VRFESAVVFCGLLLLDVKLLGRDANINAAVISVSSEGSDDPGKWKGTGCLSSEITATAIAVR